MKKSLPNSVFKNYFLVVFFVIISFYNYTANAQCTGVLLDNLYDPAVPGTTPDAAGKISIQQAGGTILNGGQRDINVTYLPGNFNANDPFTNAIISDPFYNGMAISNVASGFSNLSITYDGTDAAGSGISFSPGLGNIDMSGAGAFSFTESHDNFNYGAQYSFFLTYTYYVYTDATHYSIATTTYLNHTGNTATLISYPTTSFVTGSGAAGPADFSKVNAIQLVITNNIPSALDLTIGAINVPCTKVTALPIDIISFNAKATGNKINLNWKTTNEKEFSHFEVQKSANSKEFGTIGIINSSNNFYNITDFSPITGNNYYRLKMVDINGRYSYSKIISHYFEADNNIIAIENPVINGQIKITTNLKDVHYNVLNTMGQSVEYKITNDTNDSAIITLLNNNTKGIYYLNVQASNGKIHNYKLLVL